MDYEKKQCKKDKSFLQNNLSFLCANEKGITLLALILTVVIMIILAAVTINVALGEGGLVEQAKWAVEQTANSTKSEQEQLDDVVSQINDIIAGIGGDTNSTGGEKTNSVETNSVDTNSVDTNSVEDTNTVDTNTIAPVPEPLPDGTISIGQPQWQEDGTANVTVSTTEPDVTIEYQIGRTDEGSWISVSGDTIEGIKNGETVYVRITDGEQASNPQSTKVQDNEAPEKAIIEINPANVFVGESLTATVTHVDNGIGVAMEQSKWVMTISEAEIGTGEDVTSQYTGNFTTNGGLIILDSSNTGTYYLHVLTVDKAGNKTETVSGAITITGITGQVSQSREVSWSEGQATLFLQSSENQYKIVYKVNGQGDWLDYNGTGIAELKHGDKVTACLTNSKETTYGPEATFEIKDEIAPEVSIEVNEVTFDSIIVSVEAHDNESGLRNVETYQYYINDELKIATTETKYEFKDLKPITNYTIRIEAYDKANNSGKITEQVTTLRAPSEVEIAKESETIFGSTTPIKDELGNTIVIPGGFHIDGEYSGTKVEDGIVIEDDVGNQFVWIPIGNVKKSNGAAVNIELGRYKFDTEGTPVLTQSADNYTEETYIKENKNFYEIYQPKISEPNTNALKLQSYIENTKSTGGYYLARFEASYGSGNNVENYMPLSKPSNSSSETMNYNEGALWNCISEIDAATISRNMYKDNEYVTSDLVNSYAWDTALVYINKCSENGKYLKERTGDNLVLSNTGTTDDIACNIYDLASNLSEWTTETSTDRVANLNSLSFNDKRITVSSSQIENKLRGGIQWETGGRPQHSGGNDSGDPLPSSTSARGENYSNSKYKPTLRTAYDNKIANSHIGFRAILYIGKTEPPPDIPGGNESLEEGSIVASNTIWKEGKTSIILNTNTEFQIEYQINGLNSEKWIKISNGQEITNLKYGDTVFARLTDGMYVGDYASINILDGQAPTIQMEIDEVNYNSIEISVSANDNESGLVQKNTYSYYINNELKETSEKNNYTFTNLLDGVEYEIKVETRDKAGNVASERKSITTIAMPTIEEKLKTGDYVYYYKREQIKCVVLYDNSSNNGIEIIPMKSVNNVLLGYMDPTVEEGADYFEKAVNSYNNAINTLNNAANDWLNTDYADKARCIGSVPDNPSHEEEMFVSDETFMLDSKYNGKLKNTDNNYVEDVNQMKMLNIQNINENYWLASRNISLGNQSYDYCIRLIDNKGKINGACVPYLLGGDYGTGFNRIYGLRPVLHLKSNLKISEGDGTEENPYILQKNHKN